MINPQTSYPLVGELVAEKPGRSRVFEKLGIDYCCGGKRPLDVACAEKGLDPETLLQALKAFDAASSAGGDGRDWRTAPLSELADHIVATHHAYLREELPRLSALVNKVAGAHGEHRPELLQVREIFAALKAEMEQHMMKEEQILFPMCKVLETANAVPSFHCGSVQNPIRVMEHEHDSAGNALHRMNAMTHGYTPPQEACNSYRAMLEGLERLEADMHQHVHKENNILFPRAIALEETLSLNAAR